MPVVAVGHGRYAPGMHRLMMTFVAASLTLSHVDGQPRDPLPLRVEARLGDRFNPTSPGRVDLGGWLGERVALNASRRLAEVDLEPLLAGYRKKPGSHPWIGEHIGKWMHAATLAWADTGDVRLREKLDYAARELIAAQEADGYLGTYEPAQRFGLFANADWDVWSHKYCLIGLLTYHQYTGSAEALAAARRAADLLIRTFGAGGKSILSAGTHVGMAATSVLEPIVVLYRVGGDERYLAFARSIVAAWDEPGGPRVLETLTKTGAVNQTANGKAYEMLSNLVGLCELARATGETRLLTPAVNAWEDIVRNQLYITGSASAGEHFRAAHELPNEQKANVGETCVTVTWMQLCMQLLRITGDAKYADEFERAAYNHLCAAQRPDGGAWCYYTSLDGKKPYGDATNCCLSSGPRGLTLVPAVAYLTSVREGTPYIVINTFETSAARLVIPDAGGKRGDGQAGGGYELVIEQASGFPRAGSATITFSPPQEAVFGVLIRGPRWAQPVRVREAPAARYDDGGWLVVPPRSWKAGDSLHLEFALTARAVRGDFGNAGSAALTWGPFVLAYDKAENPGGPAPAEARLIEGTRPTLLAPPDNEGTGNPLRFGFELRRVGDASVVRATLVPFADAGRTGGEYRVWLPAE